MLKPCPFCGCDAATGTVQGCLRVVACTGCGARFETDVAGTDDAVRRWNRRARPAPWWLLWFFLGTFFASILARCFMVLQ